MQNFTCLEAWITPSGESGNTGMNQTFSICLKMMRAGVLNADGVFQDTPDFR